MKILDLRLGDIFPLPQYATQDAAGMDLRAMLTSDLVLEPGQNDLISAGIAIYLEDPSLCAMIIPRSGLGHQHGIILGNSVGLIDADYQGPLMISCWNRSLKAYTIHPGDRIAQLVIVPIVRAQFTVVPEFIPTDRGAGGFGHSGKS